MTGHGPHFTAQEPEAQGPTNGKQQCWAWAPRTLSSGLLRSPHSPRTSWSVPSGVLHSTLQPQAAFSQARGGFISLSLLREGT